MELSKTVDTICQVLLCLVVEENIEKIKNYFEQNPNASIRKTSTQTLQISKIILHRIKKDFLKIRIK